MARQGADASPVYQLKVTLQDTRPPIWRRLQVAMGWTDSHLHRFFVGGVDYGQPDPDFADDMRSEQRVRLAQLITPEKASFGYEYDFGDRWIHKIVLEKILPPDPAAHYPRCLTGKRACPPEDVGGVWGYADVLAAIRVDAHPEHDAMLEWGGGMFDPEAFSLDEVNHALARF